MIADRVQRWGRTVRRVFAKSVRRGRRQIFGYLFPRYAQRRKRERWERSWSRHDFAPGWSGGPIPRELRDAVETGWFASGGVVLDIGCGDGRLGSWLAHRGYRVVGIDFSPAAIAKAKTLYGDTNVRLEFEVADVCSDNLGERRFDAVIDRGTLQSIGVRARADYVRNVAAAAKSHARFLVLYPSSVRQDNFRGSARNKTKLIGRLESLFAPAFEVERVTDAVFGDERDGQPFARGIALWMVRRGGA
jgi:SAM-dependent methyltransferase